MYSVNILLASEDGQACSEIEPETVRLTINVPAYMARDPMILKGVGPALSRDFYGPEMTPISGPKNVSIFRGGMALVIAKKVYITLFTSCSFLLIIRILISFVNMFCVKLSYNLS